MAPSSPTPRRTPTGRRRGRPPGTTNAARAARLASVAAAAASEPPPKRRRYIPGGPGGGGRFVEAADPTETPTVARSRVAGGELANRVSASANPIPHRERSTRTRAAASEDAEEAAWGSAAAAVASLKQADDYKPREERGWEEFHPNLDIDKIFAIFTAEEVDGLPPAPSTPIMQSSTIPLLNGSLTPSRLPRPASTGNTPTSQDRTESNPFDRFPGTPPRRPRRQTRDVVSFYAVRPIDLAAAPRTPRILPIQNQTPKERLDLKLPSYRKTNRIKLFESKTFGQARYVDKAMSNVGYQESDHFIRPDATLIKAAEGNADDADADLSPGASIKSEEQALHYRLGRVEYDMDEQDDMWLEHYNAQRKQNGLEAITREVFEITMTKIEKEWHALERRIPKPNPKPPQTHRPRSSSAAAVNGETTQATEEPDSKCAVCDDGDCENTNAIVFCDGCNLAVHQECYGVPFIPEGQWLCRKCQLCGRGVPTCIFCPNTDGAFKQTNNSKWAHLLCAMWIPEVSLGNHTFMEPVMDVEKVPKTRWKLSCYICHQKMGACIQCGNKNCYQAFHVTCARRARLFLKMKTSQGALAVLDGGMLLKAFCDKHCPSGYGEENEVEQATRAAKKFYRRNMRGRIWADNQAIARVIAAQHRVAITEHPPDESQMIGAKNLAVLGEKKKGQTPRNLWKLPSGAPIIPQAVFEVVEASIQRFSFRKRKDFLSEVCRYWTLKREARRGAALLKRLQLQMETFSSMELTRRDFASMGPTGKARLGRRIDFARGIIRDLEQLKVLAEEVTQRERLKLEAAELEQDFVDECYFPVAKLLAPAIEKAISLDKDLFSSGLAELQMRVGERFYVAALSFAQDLGAVIGTGIVKAPETGEMTVEQRFEAAEVMPAKGSFADVRERRKLGKRILKAVQPYLEKALRVESEISNKPLDGLLRELEALVEASVESGRGGGVTVVEKKEKEEEDTIMVDAPMAGNKRTEPGDGDAGGGGSIEVNTSGLGLVRRTGSAEAEVVRRRSKRTTVAAAAAANGMDPWRETPPDNRCLTAATAATKTTTTTSSSLSTTGAGHAGPPTPPQSNGSLGKEPTDALTEGGLLWYLKAMEPRGTSILGEHWAAGRDAVRMLSEDLTDLDDEELKGLGRDVDESVTGVGLRAGGAGGPNGGGPGGTKNKASGGGGGGRSRRRRASGRRR